MSDQTGTRLRERVWIEKWDKTGDEPKLVGTTFIENGVLQEALVACPRCGEIRMPVTGTACAQCASSS